MHDPYSIVNLRSCLENVNLPSLLSSFSCPSNPDVEQFLLHNSIEFTKKDQSGQSYHTAAYLIAQLGKNYAISKNQQINGSILLSFALDTISKLKYSVGGVMEFLECEDNEFLLQFYTQNHFKLFSTRITTSSNHTLHQLLKFI